MRLLAALAALLLAGCAPLAPKPGDASLPWQQRHPALAYLQYSPLPDSVVHALRIDLQAPGLQVQISPPAERGQALDRMASSSGALAAINASFFNKDYQPRGLTVSQGEAWQPVMSQQASPLLACDDRPRCLIQLQPPFEPRPGWFNVVAGTPWLLDQGRQRTAADDASCANLCAMMHPRTAVGLDASGRWLFLVVSEGRRPPVLGLTLTQLSAVMKQLGAHQAVNLDGGGSSTMLLQGQSMPARPFNEPQLRKLANALLIRAGEAGPR
jgi:hypothetical protein